MTGLKAFRVLAAVVVAGLVATPPLARAQAENWPTSPIRLILGYPPGGAADAAARSLAPAMGRALGQPVVVDYKPGAGGTIGADAVAKAKPDGYTIGLVDGGPLTITPHLRAVPYDPFKGFTPIGMAARQPLVVLVNPSVQATSIPELVRLAKSSPQELTYSSSGSGTIHHLAGELFRMSTHSPMVHVPYKGAAPALTDLMAGQIPVSFATLAPAIELIKSGKVRAIAVTSDKRSSALPSIPTVAEQGVSGYDATGWLGVVGPPGLSPTIVNRLASALAIALDDPRASGQLQLSGYELTRGGPKDLSTLISTDYAKWGKVIQESHIRLD